MPDETNCEENEPDPEDIDPVYEAWRKMREVDGEGVGVRASGEI